jgi:transcriptional regulator with XRE-family HTH domain
VSRLKRSVLASLHEAFQKSGTASQSDLARRLHVRRSAVNQVFNGDGNLRVSTLAEYLYEMGYELSLQAVEAGELRAAALAGRAAAPTAQQANVSLNVTFLVYVQSPAGPSREVQQVGPGQAGLEAARSGTVFVRSLGSAGSDVAGYSPLPLGRVHIEQPRSAQR